MKKTIDSQKERLIGLDILRIISMVLITLRHFIGYAGLTQATGLFTVNGILIRVLDVLCGSAVNIFVLISGYFLVDSKFKWSRVLKIWGETFFYSVICFLLAVGFHVEKITSGRLLLSFAPLLTRHYWFTVAYLALYVLAPFLNKLIHALTEKEHLTVVLGGAVLLSAWTSIVYFSEGVLTGGNTGLLWFIYLYLMGAFVKKHQDKLPGTKVCALGALAVVAGLTVYSLLCEKLSFLNNLNWLEDDSIFELALSVLLFGAFLRLKGNSAVLNKVIVAISGCSFGVYLIQESCMIREWLWYRFVKAETYAEKWYLLPLALAIVVGLFVIAFLGHKLFEFVYTFLENLFLRKKKK